MSYFVSKTGHLDPVSTVLYTVRTGGPDTGSPDVGGPDVEGPDVRFPTGHIGIYFLNCASRVYLYLPRQHFCKVDIACLHFIKDPDPSMLKNSSYI